MNGATIEKPTLEPGEHSHRCGKCQRYWKHENPNIWDMLTGEVTKDDYEERHKSPCCGEEQYDRAATCSSDGKVHDFEDED